MLHLYIVRLFDNESSLDPGVLTSPRTHRHRASQARSNNADRPADALRDPVGGSRDTANCKADAAHLPDDFVEPLHGEQNRRDGQDD